MLYNKPKNLWATGCILVLFAATGEQTVTAANLFRNPSFEEIPRPVFRQGILPSEWLQAGDISPGADTYSVDGSYGLAAGDFGHWAGQIAQDGIRWVAGAEFSRGPNEAFGQELQQSDRLVVGGTYDLSGYIKNDTRASSSANGGFEILLAESASILSSTVALGTLDPATSATDWQFRTFSFVAPSEAAMWKNIIFRPFTETPGDFVYPALDSVSLTQIPMVVPFDIKLGSDPNSVNLLSKGVLPVAILSTDDFNVNEVDIETLLFGDPLLLENGGTAVRPLRSAFEDVSGDGLDDLTLKFSMTDLVESEALGPDTLEGLLTGALLSGTPIEGSDTIRIVTPNRNNSSSFSLSAVPEPSTLTLLALSTIAVLPLRRKNRAYN